MFAAAGVPVPRCGYAEVSVNGAPLGIYDVIDEVDHDFLARRLPAADGDLYEGTANDFRADAVGGFQSEVGPDAARATLEAVTTVLAEASDDGLSAALAELIDLDAFYRYWATEVLVWHRDGYSGNANNFYVYADPSEDGKLRFFPWGPDSALNPNVTVGVPDSVLAFGLLTYRLYQTAEGRTASTRSSRTCARPCGSRASWSTSCTG